MWKPVCNFPNYEVSSNGYYGVILVKEGRRFYRAVHRLKASNLEWCTAKYNIRYGSCIDRRADKQERRIAGGFRWKYEQEN